MLWRVLIWLISPSNFTTNQTVVFVGCFRNVQRIRQPKQPTHHIRAYVHDHGAEASLRVIYERNIFAYFHPFWFVCVCFMKSSIFYLCCDTTGTDKKGWKLNLPVRSCECVWESMINWYCSTTLPNANLLTPFVTTKWSHIQMVNRFVIDHLYSAKKAKTNERHTTVTNTHVLLGGFLQCAIAGAFLLLFEVRFCQYRGQGVAHRPATHTHTQRELKANTKGGTSVHPDFTYWWRLLLSFVCVVIHQHTHTHSETKRMHTLARNACLLDQPARAKGKHNNNNCAVLLTVCPALYTRRSRSIPRKRTISARTAYFTIVTTRDRPSLPPVALQLAPTSIFLARWQTRKPQWGDNYHNNSEQFTRINPFARMRAKPERAPAATAAWTRRRCRLGCVFCAGSGTSEKYNEVTDSQPPPDWSQLRIRDRSCSGCALARRQTGFCILFFYLWWSHTIQAGMIWCDNRALP